MAPKNKSRTTKAKNTTMTDEEAKPIRSEAVEKGGGEELSAIGAGNSATSTRLDNGLRANGEEHLYDQIMQLAVHVEDDPPVIFGWQNVEEFVRAINAARAQVVLAGPLPPDPLALPPALSVQTFKEAVLEYARIQGAPARLDTTCLPCSLAQSLQVVSVLQRLDLNPWTQRIIIAVGVPNAVPIACVYVPRPRSNTFDRATPQFPNSYRNLIIPCGFGPN